VIFAPVECTAPEYKQTYAHNHSPTCNTHTHTHTQTHTHKGAALYGSVPGST